MLKRSINLSTRLFIRLFPSPKPILFTGAGPTIKLASLVGESGLKHPLPISGTALLEHGHLDDLGLLAIFARVTCETALLKQILDAFLMVCSRIIFLQQIKTTGLIDLGASIMQVANSVAAEK